FLGDIGERAVTIVLVERVTERLRGFVEIRRAAVHQVQVHPSVVIVIQERATWTERFRQVALGRDGVFVDPGDAPRRRGDLFKNEAVSSRCRRRTWHPAATYARNRQSRGASQKLSA